MHSSNQARSLLQPGDGDNAAQQAQLQSFST
jgi:hypothetical protein